VFLSGTTTTNITLAVDSRTMMARSQSSLPSYLLAVTMTVVLLAAFSAPGADVVTAFLLPPSSTSTTHGAVVGARCGKSSILPSCSVGRDIRSRRPARAATTRMLKMSSSDGSPPSDNDQAKEKGLISADGTFYDDEVSEETYYSLRIIYILVWVLRDLTC
jgi:hypothetical protein